MRVTEEGNIFKQVAQMAGDIVFKYDLVTGKFMQYSDKIELSRYGSWIFDFVNSSIAANMIHKDDVDVFRNVMGRITRGESGSIEGMFRMRIHASSEYRWSYVHAQTRFVDGKAVEVIGRITDEQVHYERMKHSRDFAGRNTAAADDDKELFLQDIVRYSRNHRTDVMSACVIFDYPAYTYICENYGKADAEEFAFHVTSNIRRSFPFGTVIRHIGGNLFGVFLGSINLLDDIGPAIEFARQRINLLAGQYKTSMEASVGVCMDNNRGGAELDFYEKAKMALGNAYNNGSHKVEFFTHTESEELDLKQQSEETSDSFIMEYALKYLGDDSDDRMSIKSIVDNLVGLIGKNLGIDRVAVSLCKDGVYREYSNWQNDKLKGRPEGSFLHVVGKADIIESAIDREKGFVVSNVFSYPDDSPYGQMISSTAVVSIAQKRFETNGAKGVVSMEFYGMPHTWTQGELDALAVAGQVADICVKYLNRGN